MSEAVPMAPPTVSFTYDLSIAIELKPSDVSQILLNGSTAPPSITLPEDNVHAQVATVTVVTHSGKPWTVPLVLGGLDGSKFALTNSAVAPCNLIVGAASITEGGYSIKISAPPS